MARDGWVTVASRLRAHEAALLRNVLESEEIPVAVEDEVMSSLELLPAPFGGARVLVPVEAAEQAAGIVASTGFAAGGPATFGEIPEEEWSRGGTSLAGDRSVPETMAATDGETAARDGAANRLTRRAPGLRGRAFALLLAALAFGLLAWIWRAVLRWGE